MRPKLFSSASSIKIFASVDRTQVYGTPKHVIDGKLVPDTESAWGAGEWADKLKSL